MKKLQWKKYAFEFLSIFIAVISAFALNNWNDNRQERISEKKILHEIKNGLNKDIEDININTFGHNGGIRACIFIRNLITKNSPNTDSLLYYYYNLTRDFISIQNQSGYESLKSNGLEIIRNDSLRFEIISLYEYDYSVLEKFEENYAEMQFHASYFKEINTILSPHLPFDSLGRTRKMEFPLKLNNKERNILLSYLGKIEGNRRFILTFYAEVQQKIADLNRKIEAELKQ